MHLQFGFPLIESPKMSVASLVASPDLGGGVIEGKPQWKDVAA